jgi:hypothetical protein
VTEVESLSGIIGIEYQLDETGSVAQIDEDETTVITSAMDPASHAHRLPYPGRQDLAAPGAAEAIRFGGRQTG